MYAQSALNQNVTIRPGLADSDKAFRENTIPSRTIAWVRTFIYFLLADANICRLQAPRVTTWTFSHDTPFLRSSRKILRYVKIL